MQTAIRSYLTAGVAFAGAGVIAVSPVAPIPTDIQLPAVHASSAAVTLNALTNPLDAWAQTLSAASTNLQALGAQLLASDAPILRTVISNQVGNATVVADAFQTYGGLLDSTLKGLPAALQTASDLVAQGQITEALGGLTDTLLPAIVGVLDLMNSTWSGVSTTTQNLENVIKAVPLIVQSVALPALFPVLSVVNGLAATAEEVVTAANAGDTEGFANAFINAPAHLTDAFLNGKGTILGFINTPGLLSPESGFGFLGDGPITSILNIPKTIAGLLDPNPLAPVTASAAATSAKLTSTAVHALSSGTTARSVTLSVPASDTAADAADTAVKTDSTKPVDDAAAAESTSSTTDVNATATDTDGSASTSVATPTKKADATTSPAKRIRDNIKKAAQRITGKPGTNSDRAGSSAAGPSSKGPKSSGSGHSGAGKSTHKRSHHNG